MIKSCVRLSLTFIILGFFLLVGVRVILPSLVFLPTAELIQTPAALNLSYEDVFLTTSDDVRLHGWYIPAKEDARATLLFFHCNAGNISENLNSVAFFNSLELSVFIIGYRGYGKSGGVPSIEGTKLDALAAWQWLSEYRKIPADRIVVFGRSLGGAVAVELMRSAAPGGLILETKFSSLADMSPFPLFIAPFLLGGDFWNSTQTAAGVVVPTLIIHRPHDGYAMYKQSRRVYEALAGEKTFLNTRAYYGYRSSFEMYAAGIDSFLAGLFDEVTVTDTKLQSIGFQ